MISQTDPRKLKALLKDSQAVISEEEDEDGGSGSDGADDTDDEGAGGDAGDDDEQTTVESLTSSFKPAVAAINEIVDEFRTGTDAQPKAGLERLEEEINAELVHDFCAWTDDVGKRDFRALGDGLDLEEVTP